MWGDVGGGPGRRGEGGWVGNLCGIRGSLRKRLCRWTKESTPLWLMSKHPFRRSVSSVSWTPVTISTCDEALLRPRNLNYTQCFYNLSGLIWSLHLRLRVTREDYNDIHTRFSLPCLGFLMLTNSDSFCYSKVSFAHLRARKGLDTGSWCNDSMLHKVV